MISVCFVYKGIQLETVEAWRTVCRINLQYAQSFCLAAESRHYFHHDYVTPFLQVISPGLEKQSIQSRPREEEKGRKKGRFEREISPEVVGVLRGEEKKARSRGPAYISLSSNSFMSSKLFQRPELLCLCCALKSLAGLYEEKQWEHFRKSYKGSGRAEEERKSEWHHW